MKTDQMEIVLGKSSSEKLAGRPRAMVGPGPGSHHMKGSLGSSCALAS